MVYDRSRLEKLTDESKDAWDFIYNHLLPIKKRNIEIEPSYMFCVLNEAIDCGVIRTNTRKWSCLYAFRNGFPLYLCESWLVRILYSMDIEIRYIKSKQPDNSYWYTFYAKITYGGSGWERPLVLRRFIDLATEKYINNQNN